MGKGSMKNIMQTMQASTLKELPIQTANLNNWMTLLRIYLKLLVTLRQWWNSKKDINVEKLPQDGKKS